MMPEGIGYSDDERKAAEELMQLGSVGPDEFLEKLSGMGFRLEKSGGAPPMDEPPADAPLMDEPPMDEPKEEEPKEEEPPSDEEGEGKPPIGLNIVMLRKKAAKKAMNKHDY
ncbi:MAG: hypothetical protein JRC86_08350 [Deltaproteobacteria bacterium]|nr:hypothetical protein [Deltaproteobacteria bacterium]